MDIIIYVFIFVIKYSHGDVKVVTQSNSVLWTVLSKYIIWFNFSINNNCKMYNDSSFSLSNCSHTHIYLESISDCLFYFTELFVYSFTNTTCFKVGNFNMFFQKGQIPSLFFWLLGLSLFLNIDYFAHLYSHMNFEFIRKSPKPWHFLNWNYGEFINLEKIHVSNSAIFLLLEHDLSSHLFRLSFANFSRFLCFLPKSPL